MEFSTYSHIYRNERCEGERIIFSARTGAIISVPDALIDDMSAGRLTPEEEQALADFGMLVESREAEQKGMLKPGDVAADKTYILAMNLDCNLACPYCFEKGVKGGSLYLTEEIARLFVERVAAESYGRQGAKVLFYGGEPFLSFDLMSRIARDLKTRLNSDGKTFSSSIITNGTMLTRERLLAMKEDGGLAGVKVTLDGPPETHDTARPFKGGGGSFDVIARNIAAVSGLVRMQIGGNYTMGNYRAFPGIFGALKEYGISAVEVRFDPVISAPCASSLYFAVDDPGFAEASVHLRGETLRNGFSVQKIIPVQCMMEDDNKVVVNYNGDMYSCPGFLGNVEYRIGNISDADIPKRVGQREWQTNCIECSYLPLCRGGCHYMKFLRTGNANGIECRKAYFDKTLEAMVNQDVIAETMLSSKNDASL